MARLYGYDSFVANEYIDTSDMLMETEPAHVAPAPTPAPTPKESFVSRHMPAYGRRVYTEMEALRKQVAEQKSQMMIMWLLLIVCVVVIINMRSSAHQMSQLIYWLQMSGSMPPKVMASM